MTADDGTSISVRGGPTYPYGQVWVPAGRPFVALEPMAAPTNSLVEGTAQLIAPGETFTARFTITIGQNRDLGGDSSESETMSTQKRR